MLTSHYMLNASSVLHLHQQNLESCVLFIYEPITTYLEKSLKSVE